MKRESKYASCLNALDEMQQSVIYAARKGFLAEAESIIVRLESETAEQRAEIERLKEELAQWDDLKGKDIYQRYTDVRAQLKEMTAQLATAKREVWVSVMDHIRATHSGPDLTSTRALMELYDWCRKQKEVL